MAVPQVIWRAWGRRAQLGLAGLLVWALFGGWVARLVFVCAVAGLLGMYRSAWWDRLLVHEETHLLRCRIRRTWRHVTAGAGLAKADLYPSIRGRIAVRDGMAAMLVRPAAGHHADTWRAAAPGLAVAWRVSDVEVVDRLSRRGRGTGLLGVRVSALGVPHRTIPWPVGILVHPWGPGAVPVGQAGGNRVATVSLLDPPHMLVAGPTGGGKSSFLNALLCGVAPLEDVAVVMIDLKGVDFARWGPRLSVNVWEPADVQATLAWLVAVMEDRFLILRRDGQEQWQHSRDGPRIVCVIDEFAELAPALHPALFRLAAKGRAAGISVVLCTQRPVATLGPRFTDIRSQLGTRVALGPLSRAEATLVLGDGNVPPVWPRFPPGVARIQAAHAGQTVRVYWCRDVIDEVVAATAGLRPGLPGGLRLT